MEKLRITSIFLITAATVALAHSALGEETSNRTGAAATAANDRQFQVVYEWQTIDFAFPNVTFREDALENGAYVPLNNILSDIKPYDDRLYVTLPRMLHGVPATLGWVPAPRTNGRTNPLVQPFPSWDMNTIGNCSALQFVQGIAIDADGILWVVDSGRSHTLGQGTVNSQSMCPPKLLTFDLKRNGYMTMSFEFPNDIVPHKSNYLNKIVVDDALGGFAYITDNSDSDPGIVVFSKQLTQSWKIRDSTSMRADHNEIAFAVGGIPFNYSVHIDGIALGPYQQSPNTSNEEFFERNVYFCPLSSRHLYSVPASILRDSKFARASAKDELKRFIVDHGVKDSQSDGMLMDNKGVLYFSLLKSHAIAEWNSTESFTLRNQRVIAKDPDFIQWTDGMGIDEQGYLYVVVNRLNSFISHQFKTDRTNMRVLRSKIGTLSYVFNSDAMPAIRRAPFVPLSNGATTDTNRTNDPHNGADGHGRKHTNSGSGPALQLANAVALAISLLFGYSVTVNL